MALAQQQTNSDSSSDSSFEEDPDDNLNELLHDDHEEDEFDPEPPPTESSESEGEEEAPTGRRRRRSRARIRSVTARDGNTLWYRRPPGNDNPPQIMLRLQHASGPAINLTDPLQLINCFITDEIKDLIIQNTNDVILRNRGSFTQDYQTRLLTLAELNAFFGIIYLTGALKNSKLRVRDTFSPRTGAALFLASMSVNRFKFLHRYIRFNRKEQPLPAQPQDQPPPVMQPSPVVQPPPAVQPQPQQNQPPPAPDAPIDRFRLFRQVWELFVAQCQINYSPGSHMTVDESILSFRGRCGFKVYMPAKPDKYGLKIFSLADAGTAYFYNGIPYLGAAMRQQGALQIPTQQVLQVVQPIINSHRTITVDNYFTSMELADELLERNLTIVGTMRRNKRELPQNMLYARRIDVQKTKFLYQRDKILVSYVPKPRKLVLLLSTAFQNEGQIDEDTGKPKIVLHYNRTKGGVDTINQKVKLRTTARKTRRWTMRYQYGIADLAAHNAYILHQLNGGNLSRFRFLTQLAEAFAIPFIHERLANPRISTDVKVRLRMFLGLPAVEQIERLPPPPRPNQRPTARCYICPRSRDRRGASYCTSCNRPVCGEHRNYVCVNCFNRIISRL